jgi:hypothetical protein
MIGVAIYESASEKVSMEEARSQLPPVEYIWLLGLAGADVGAPYVWTGPASMAGNCIVGTTLNLTLPSQPYGQSGNAMA